MINEIQKDLDAKFRKEIEKQVKADIESIIKINKYKGIMPKF